MLNKTAAPARGARERSSGDLDQLIHERSRLGLVSALASHKSMSFTELKALLQISDGNLSTHARKLEEAGYIECSKGFDGRMPRTEYRLSASGRRALNKYVAHMEALIAAMKK
ncbi:transcriptional regulator [Pseudohongiella acticola]|uniref:Transcriptional regulator n=1 Tax=Pseudohongiella acticola TaxID=1524254 RepID=A0A1E8CFR0_9GAMM|nr:transcriptional regulator [Pseudohongiella acticola]